MDPLTHTLVGANLASTKLGKKTRLATAACLIGANAPDIDVSAYFRGEDFAIGFRRGWTHGALAVVVLPVVLWVILLLWDRARRGGTDPSEGSDELRPRLNPGWLLTLCAIAVLTHPFLDWLNVYGMRLLMPFDPTWFYGDSVFIMDPWLWLILGAAWLVPRRSNWKLLTVWGVFSGLLMLVVSGRAPRFLPLIVTIALILLAALLWKPGGESRRHRFGLAGLAAAMIYILGMIGLHHLTDSHVGAVLTAEGVEVEELMVGPLPVDSLGWDVLAVAPDHYRFGTWSWWTRKLELSERKLPKPPENPLWSVASTDPSIEGFMTWVRYPWIETEEVEGGTRVWILDARYTREREAGFGGASVVVEQGRRGGGAKR